MKKRVFYNLLKAKGFEVTATYELDNGDFYIRVKANRFVHNDEWQYIADSVTITWWNDKMDYCYRWYSNDITNEEYYTSFSPRNVEDMEETLLDMICNL